MYNSAANLKKSQFLIFKIMRPKKSQVGRHRTNALGFPIQCSLPLSHDDNLDPGMMFYVYNLLVHATTQTLKVSATLNSPYYVLNALTTVL
jgi:hypothetical protein